MSTIYISRAVNPLSHEIFQHAFRRGNEDFFWNNPFIGKSTGRLDIFLVKTFNIILNNKLMSRKVDIAKSSFIKSFKINLFKALAITNTSPALLQKTKYTEVQLDIFCS